MGTGSVYAEDSIHSSAASSSAFEAALKQRPSSASDGLRSAQTSTRAGSVGAGNNVYGFSGADSTSNGGFAGDGEGAVGGVNSAGASKFERYPRIGSPHIQQAPYYFAIG